MAAASRPIPATANAAAASGTVAAGSTSKANAKTLTKKKLQEFDEANQRQEPTTSNQRTQKFLSKGHRERKQSELTLSEDGEEAVRELLSLVVRAHQAAVYPPRNRTSQKIIGLPEGKG